MVTGLSASNSAPNEWCADAGMAASSSAPHNQPAFRNRCCILMLPAVYYTSSVLLRNRVRRLVGVDRIQDGLHHRVLADRRVDHQVKILTRRPLHPEMLFDKCGAVQVHGFRQFDGFLLAFPRLLQTANLLRKRRINENVKCVRCVLQIIARTPANDHAVSLGRRAPHQLLGDRSNALRVRQLQTVRVEASLETAPQKRFEHTIVQRVAALLTLLHMPLVTLQLAGDFGGEQLIPKLPTQTIGHLLRDLVRAASVFAFNGQHFDHGFLPGPQPTAISPPAPGSFFRTTKVSTNIMLAATASTM